ncbi:hypothetical protein DIZ81_07010 [Legionella taurinensis]|uniref:Uncharacterized protein n=2 Tax=Legionella taurinensis TaxID=70611 RepID=A0A3A5L358_9GAMM|nr:hypothetical protein DB744_07010 [Legionella taurinensis]PUT41581.1 hypothetical protein DB746_09520 [Legionella taurinensis]PUT44446.1 hypothetical protein DB743_08735 [Legionella taurinensis]PUT48408.1 hypothetical protein DB745_05410 [Legionella taurinensis]RJT46216.1 hypothetical protein D6J04_09190 [Legionella taurinensis]
MKDDKRDSRDSKDKKPTLNYTKTYSQFPNYGNTPSPARTGKLKTYDSKPASPAFLAKDNQSEAKSATLKSKSTPPLPGKEDNDNQSIHDTRVMKLPEVDELPASPSSLVAIRDSALLEIDLQWLGNPDSFRKQIITWQQSQFKNRLFEMICLLGEMLKNPGQYLYFVDPFSKQHYSLTDDAPDKAVKRHYSYFGILNQLHALLRDCREVCETNALFELSLNSGGKETTLEDAFKSRPVLSLFAYKEAQNTALQAFLAAILAKESLQKDLTKAKTALLNTLSEKQKQDTTLMDKTGTEAAKVAVLLKASSDLLDICNRLDSCPNLNSLGKIRHLTVVHRPTSTASAEDGHGFMDLLGFLNSSNMPHLESLIIEHYDPRNYLELSNLIAVLVKKNSSLKIMISHHFPEKDKCSVFSPYQDKYPGLSVKRINVQATIDVENTCTFFPASPSNKRRSASEQSPSVRIDYSPK